MLMTLILAALLGIFMLPSCSQTCIGELCLTKQSEMKSFDEARSWCQINNSTLAAINYTGNQMTVTELLKQSNFDSQMFINMKLSQRSENTWFLINGSNYSGQVGNQNYSAYKQYSYLRPHINDYTYVNEFLVEASEPSVLRFNLCEFEGATCLNNSTSNFRFMNRCYVKYDNESLTWYKARERCIDNGGDIAQFQQGSSSSYIPPFNTSWLNQSLSYWAGIRWKVWSWKYSGDTNEVIQTYWSDGKPNNVNYECVCVDPKGNPTFAWTDCDCATPRPFACLKIVPTTTVITTTTTMTSVTTRTPIPTTTASDPTGHTNNSLASASGKELSTDQKIGLAVGIGGGVLIIIIVVIIVLAVVMARRKRKSNNNSESRPAVDDSGENDDEGISNHATESNVKDLYSQVQKPPRNQVNNLRGKDVYAQVNKPPHNQINNDVYADVVPNANQQTNKTESPPEIFYSAPEFVQDPKSPTDNSNYDVACRVHEPDLLPTPRGEIQSIFPIRYSRA